MQEPIDELLEWLHTFDDLQFSCNHRNVIEKIWQIKSKKQFAIPVVAHTLKDCLIGEKPVKYNNKKYYLTTLEITNNGEEICKLMCFDTYETISNVNGKNVKIF